MALAGCCLTSNSKTSFFVRPARRRSSPACFPPAGIFLDPPPLRYRTSAVAANEISPRLRLRLRPLPGLWLILSEPKLAPIRDALEGARSLWRRDPEKAALSVTVSAVLMLCFLLINLAAAPFTKRTVPYSALIAKLQDGSVSAVLFEEGSRRIFFSTVENPRKWRYSTRKVDHDEGFLLGLMREKGTVYSSASQSVSFVALRGVLVMVLSVWIPLAPLMLLLHRQISAANSPSKKYRPSVQSVRFDDVQGIDVAKEELMEIVSCLQGSISYNKLGASLPRGVLLVGPTGTGKTLLARAVAGETNVPFFSASASEFVELFVGRGAARIRDLFNVAKKCTPSIIFIDELDAVGGRRGRSFNDERDQTLNQLLTEMDGFESDSRIIVIAATNRPEALDPALCRPGRFSRKVAVAAPDFEGRIKILSLYFREVPLEEAPDLICNLVATLTPGFVGADLANIVNEAAFLAARRGGNSVSREDVMGAIERAKFGIKDNNRETPGPPTKKGFNKLFPWMPPLGRREDTEEEFQGLMGYETVS